METRLRFEAVEQGCSCQVLAGEGNRFTQVEQGLVLIASDLVNMEKAEKAVMVDDGESGHNAVKALQYDVLEHMSQWSSNWVAMQAENMKIRESCSELRRELEELKSQCGSMIDIELNGLDEEIQ